MTYNVFGGTLNLAQQSADMPAVDLLIIFLITIIH